MFGLAFALALVTDSVTKYLVCSCLVWARGEPGARTPIRLRHVRNRRLAGRRLVVLASWLTTVVGGAIVAQTVFGTEVLAQWGLGLAAGGATGNAADRLFRRSVVDFIDVRGWPVFNFADAAITCGVGLTLWSMR